MAEKDDLGSLEGDLSPQQRQFLLELSSALPDIVSSPGIAIARMRQSEKVNHLLNKEKSKPFCADSGL